MSALNFKISAQLEAAGFKQAADYMKTLSTETKNLKENNKEHAGTVDALKVAYGALVGLGIVEFFKSAYEEAAQAKEQEIQLGARVEQTGLSYEKAKPKLDAFFQALQDQSGIARDKLIPAFNFLIDKTQSVRASQELMTTTMGLARARGLQLAEAADLVGGAYNGQQRAMAQLARMMGLTTEQAKDHEKVLAILKDRYAGFAVNTDEAALAMARMQNSFKDFKEQVGGGLAAPLATIADTLRKFIAELVAGTEAIPVHLVKMIGIIRVNLELLPKIFSANFKQAKEAAQLELNGLGRVADEELKKIGDRMRLAINPPQHSQALSDLVDATKRKFAEMNDAMKVTLAEGNEAAARSDEQRLRAHLDLIDRQTEATRAQMRQMAEEARVSAADREALDTAIVKKGIAEKIKAWEQYSKATVTMAMTVGNALGVALGKALTGQEDAWASMMRVVIDTIVQGAQAYVAAWTSAKVATQLESEDYAGAAKSAAIGAVYTGLIGAAGEVAKSNIKGGSSGGAAAGGGGGSTSNQAPTMAQAAPAGGGQNSSITIYVQGDIVDSDSFMNSLAARLSDKVENQDIKLVASSVKP